MAAIYGKISSRTCFDISRDGAFESINLHAKYSTKSFFSSSNFFHAKGSDFTISAGSFPSFTSTIFTLIPKEIAGTMRRTAFCPAESASKAMTILSERRVRRLKAESSPALSTKAVPEAATVLVYPA